MTSLRQIVSSNAFFMIALLRGITLPSTYYCFDIRGITPGDWVKCVEHVLSVERVYILVKGDRGRG